MKHKKVIGEVFESTEAVPLTPEDWETLSKQATEFKTELGKYKEIKTNASDMIKGLEARLEDITDIVAKKKMFKQINCRWEFDFNSNEKKLYQILKDGNKVYLHTKPLDESDRQGSIFDKEEK